MSLFEELKQRNVFRVGAAYLVFGWLAIQVVETVFPAFGFGDGAVRVITIIFAIGLIPALLLAWVFEMTPQGLKREKDIDRSNPQPGPRGKKLDRVIIVVLSLALVYFAVDKFLVEPDTLLRGAGEVAGQDAAVVTTPVEVTPSIAVLPFRNISSDPENEYFSDGMTEEVLNLLANVAELRVISRSSAFVYKNRSVPITQVAEELNVGHVLEGSVRRSADRVRISVQLIDARSDQQQWSNTWDRALVNVFDLQNEVAASIVARLRSSLSIGDFERRAEPTQNLDAYYLYLKARQLWWEREPAPVAQAIELFKEAIALDPGFSLAHAGLASALYIDWLSNPLRAKEEWRNAARRASELGPGLAEPVILEADYQLGFGDVEEGLRLAKHSLSLEPDSTWINHMVSIYWAAAGDMQRALSLAKKAQSQDPLIHNVNANLGKVYLLLNEDKLALHHLTIADDLGMDGDLHWSMLGLAHHRLGDLDGVRATAQKAAGRMDLPESYVKMMVDLAENPDSTTRMDPAEFEEMPPLFKFDICLRTKQFECARAAFLEKMQQMGNIPSFSLLWIEEARALRRQPGFEAWLESWSNWLALMAYWTTVGWPDACPRSVDSLDCS